MNPLLNFQFGNSGGEDYFNEDLEEDFENIVHLYVQQRNGRKSWTHIKGLVLGERDNFELLPYNKLLAKIRSNLGCGGSIDVQKDDDGKVIGCVITVQGDKRREIKDFLYQRGYAKKENIKMHG